MKYSIYIYEGDLSSSDLRENLMTDAVIAYCGTHDIGYADVTVERAEKGNRSTAMFHTATICGSPSSARVSAASTCST